MNLNKHIDFFDPNELDAPVHVIGCGAIGSTLIEMLVRLGIPNMYIYDFDKVEAGNLTNQMYNIHQIGKLKTEAITEMAKSINPAVILVDRGKYTEQPLSGYVFLCVDNIDLRREITTAHLRNPYIKAVFDFRMGLTDAQHYAADWKDDTMKENFLNSMAFTHEEAKAITPVSACGTTLNITPTPRVIVAYGITNFINFLKGQSLKKMILVDTFHYILDVF